MRRQRIATFVAVLAVAASATSAQAAYAPASLESTYQAMGTFTVTKATSAASCDRENNLCDIWYPSTIASYNGKFPIVAWANGSGVPSSNYDYWLRHLASWGFVVVASRDTSTGTGTTTTDAANYMIAQGATSGSTFFGKVDGTKVGAAGHSQGGASVARLFQDMSAPFSTYVLFHPSPSWFASWCCGVTKTKIGQVTKGSILSIQSEQDGGAADTKSTYYDPVRNTLHKAYGVLASARHEDIEGQPGCDTNPTGSCLTGVYGYLGYPTLWLSWKLKGDANGLSAFSSTTGEFVKSDSDWTTRLTNIS